ncbi:MAG: MaoC family dehydratase N-terminal domain-containing protein [Ruminiclostridium sp.]|nr:MaoC family dehydratase N-terminal domain-containing protein [Ruminiclostridium sp.]
MYLEDIQIGSEVTVENIVIEKEEMLDFANRYNPVKIHTDEDFAKKTRFGELIAPGMLSFLSVWSQYTSLDFAGDDLVAGKSTAVEWSKPVFAGDVLRGVAKVTGLSFRNEHNGILTVTIDVFNQRDEKVLTSVVESVVKRRPKEQ